MKKYIILNLKNYKPNYIKKIFYNIEKYYKKKFYYLNNNKIKLIIILKNINLINNIKFNILNFIYRLKSDNIFFIIK